MRQTQNETEVGPAVSRRPGKVLFGHTPKAAGSFLIDYFRDELKYQTIQSLHAFENGVWRDFTLNELRDHRREKGFLCSHVLAFGWSSLASLIPAEDKASIVSAIRQFREEGWFTFTFVRHPGELLTSFYFYVLDAHRKGWHDSVALHAPAVGRTLDDFVSEHCEKELLPTYWSEYDYVGEASDASFSEFFATHFGHEYRLGSQGAHASGSKGYAHYCQAGEVSMATQSRIERSSNMKTYRDIIRA